MKKIAFTLIACAVLLCACSTPKNDKENIKSENSNLTQDNVSIEIPEHTEVEDPVLSAFLDGEITFIDSETGKEATIYTLQDVNENYMGKIDRFCTVDLDGDSGFEYLFEYSGGGETAVLHHEENDVWRAYRLHFRDRLNLKIDGEMSWSSGASYNGTSRLEFADGSMKQTILLYSDTDNNFHTMLGEEISYEDSLRVWNKFDKKKNSDWYSIYPDAVY